MDLLYKAYSEFLTWAGNIRIYPLGLVLFGKTSYNINGKDMREIISLIQPGDVLLRAYTNYVSSFFIKGAFSHAGIYIGENKVLHVMSEGILEEDILTFMRTDRLAVCRFNDPVVVVESAIERAVAQYNKGSEYDFYFDTSCSKRFYCSEFVDFCLGYPIRIMNGDDGKIVYPDDFLDDVLFSIKWMKNK